MEDGKIMGSDRKHDWVNHSATFNMALAVVESIASGYDFDLNLNTADELASDIVAMTETKIMSPIMW